MNLSLSSNQHGWKNQLMGTRLARQGIQFVGGESDFVPSINSGEDLQAVHVKCHVIFNATVH